MKIIAHRGNLNGRNPKLENTVEYINIALSTGFDVEIDIRLSGYSLFLGHDKADILVRLDYLQSIKDNTWIHCKDLDSFEFLRNIDGMKLFFHQNDDFALTSNGKLWTMTGKELGRNSIAVLPELITNWDINNAYGICTDYPLKYKNQFGN